MPMSKKLTLRLRQAWYNGIEQEKIKQIPIGLDDVKREVDENNRQPSKFASLKAKKTPDGIDYEIIIDGKNGYATVAMTKYYDGTEEPTLPINLGTHSICFYAE